MATFVLATANKSKLKEISEILSSLDATVITMDEAGFSEDIKEDGGSFEENALIKAEKVFRATGKIAISDDSGLAVDCLDGRPGVHSARYAGENATDDDRIDKLLSEMSGIPPEDRTARFITAVAVVWNSGSFVVRADCGGRIGFERKGSEGFGYDPIFILEEFGKTNAELPLSEKSKISARGKAFRKMLSKIMEIGPENMT